MAKHNCAICGAEIGLLSEQKLADGNFICRKVCSKKTFKIFDKVHATLDDVTAHIEQVEKGTRIWNELLLPLKKSKDKTQKLKCLGTGGPLLYVSPSTLSHKFSKELKISVYQYITKKRLSVAHKLIKQGESLKNAALSSGFNDYSCFYRLYKKYYKKTNAHL